MIITSALKIALGARYHSYLNRLFLDIGELTGKLGGVGLELKTNSRLDLGVLDTFTERCD